MAGQFQICGLTLALTDVRDNSLQRWIIGLFTSPSGPAVLTCDEDDFIPPTWDGYDGQDPTPWGPIIHPEDADYVQTDSVMMTFAVDSDPGGQTIYGWWAYDPDADFHQRVRAYELFDPPITPVEGVPFYLVVRVIHRNCTE